MPVALAAPLAGTAAAPVVITMDWRSLGARAAKGLLVASVLPVGVFYLAYASAGLWPAVTASLAWYLGALAIQWQRGRKLQAPVVLGAALMIVRAGVALWTGSAFLYFLQPVAGTLATAGAFLVSAAAGRPILDRLVHDLLPLPAALSAVLREHGYFHRLSRLWSGVYVVNAAGTVWLLQTHTVGGFLVLKTVLGPALAGCAVVASYAVFRGVLRRELLTVRWR